jgi:hypothetical protein
MADGYQLLEEEHREIERAFETFCHDEEGTIVRDLCQRLTNHTRREEAAVLPALRRYVDGGDDLADEAQAEQATISTLIAQIYDSATPERVPELVAQLRSATESHIEETESKIYPAMRSCGVDAEQLATEVGRVADVAAPTSST